MKLNVHDIDAEVKDLIYSEPTEQLNAEIVHGGVQDFEFTDKAQVHLQYHRTGDDLVFLGRIAGKVIGHCARCLEPYPFDLAADCSLIVVPKPDVSEEAELADEDLNLSFYQGDEIDLSPLIREQLILALPTKPLCSEDCQGLCPQCGINRNQQSCDCSDQGGDPRLAVLRNLKVPR
ncbi:MAG TPA: DUF177 domain-containing protein [Terriglobales bacterium]|nr:DUF177 domain-containing protein [Terriglobales bacterium]